MVKKTVLAGTFYPKEKPALTKMLDKFFLKASEIQYEENEKKLFAIIAPHAGYVFSGQIAAHIYNVVRKHKFKNAIIIAPSHYSNCCEYFIGKYDTYETPIGDVKTNKTMIGKLQNKKGFAFDQSVDLREHSLEIHFPFLRYIDPELRVVPIIFVKQNNTNAKLLAEHIKDLLDDDTLLIISTDLSHFHKSTIAETKDGLLIENLKNIDTEGFLENLSAKKIEACGYGGLLTLLHTLKNYETAEIGNIQYTHSGYTSNDFKQVVGYLSCAFYR